MKKQKKTIDLISLTKTKSDIPRSEIKSSDSAAEYARQFYFEDIGIYESVFLLLLNSRNETIGYAKISQGGVAGSVVDLKIIAKYISDTLARGIILFHNHPSGNLLPSSQDRNITRKAKEVARILDSALLDHIIITESGHYSFSDEGLL